MNSEKVHQGHNVRRFREMRRLKQEALALEMGGDWTQRRISLLEQRELIDPAILQEVAQALQIPVEAIENFSEEKAINYFNTFNDNSSNHDNHYYHGDVHINNPIEEIRKLHEEKVAIYERMLKEKDDMMARLEKLLEKIK